MDRDNLIIKCSKCGTRNRIPKSRINEKPSCGKCKALLDTSGGLSKPVDVTDSTFNSEVLSHGGAVLVDCWAPWCGPCKMVAPVLDQLASEYAGRLKVAKLNVDNNPATASQYGIQSIPTMIIFKNGRKVNQLVGAQSKEEIERQIKPVL